MTKPADIARLRDALNQLAFLYEMAGRPRGFEQRDEKYSDMAKRRGA